MTQVYKAPNGRQCVIVDGAKPANPHTLIDHPEKYASHSDAGGQALQSRTDQKFQAKHVVIQYIGPNGEHMGTDETRLDSLTAIS
jgi:hypothetical protein